MHRAVERGESRRSLAGIRHISIDEKALKRGHTYATIVSDSDRGVVIDLGQGRTKKGTIELLECILEDIKDQIETVSTDMWKAFIGAVRIRHIKGVPPCPHDSRSVSFNPVSQ